MFHEFVVDRDHKDYFCFLWWSDKYMLHPAPFRMRIHLFGASSNPGCANFDLKQIAAYNEAEYGTVVANFLRNTFYVEDGLKNVSPVSSAVDMIQKYQAMCRDGGLRLQRIASNSKDVLANIPLEDVVKGFTAIDIFCEALPVERTLWVLWNIESDCFRFPVTLSDKPLTRRGSLSTVNSIFDPLGFISPLVLVGKQILQQMCSEAIGWDGPIPDSSRMK